MNHLQMFVTGLLAQEDGAKIDEAAPASGWDAQALLTSDFAVFLLLLVTAVICFIVGRVYARSIRMGEMGWKIGLILTCLFVSAEIIAFKWPPRLGVDLKGGVVYMAQITPIADDENVKPEDLVPRLKERVDPTNTKEIMIRPYGSDMIEIVIPDVTDAEGDRIWENLTKQGVMQFRIVASRNTTGGTASSLMSYATRQASNNNKNDWVLDPNGKRVGRWVGIGRKRDQFGDLGNYRYVPRGDAVLRNAQTGQILNPPAEALQFEEGNEGAALTAWAESQDIPDLQILMEVGSFDVTGDYLANPSQGFDDRNRPAVNFQLKGKGIGYFYKLTSDNIDRPLGIVMDDRLLSAPNINSAISSQGQIMGDFSQEEVEDLVNILKSGRLPATIKEQWVSKDQVDSNIGQQMQERGLLAIAASFVAVMIFMLIYYRFSGVVACFALMVNVLMIVSLTMLISFPFSLTSLAGLVLTVGMSVDANVLIYERIREELNKGTAMRMAIRNGFARATTTIVDANVTTLITAVVLYTIGTEQIRGFAVTLILGILISMFTAIFCARVIFEVAERQRFIKKLSMMQLLHSGRIEFTRFWKGAIAISIVLILIGVSATAYRAGTKKDLLSYDLQGGTSARVVLTEPIEPDAVRQMLKDRFAGAGDYADLGPVSYGAVKSFEVDSSKVTADGYDDKLVYRVDTGLRPWEVNDDELRTLRADRKSTIEKLNDAKSDEKDELQKKLDEINASITEMTRRPEGYPDFTVILEEVFGDKLARYQLAADAPVFTPAKNVPATEGQPDGGASGIGSPTGLPGVGESTPGESTTGGQPEGGSEAPEDSGTGEETGTGEEEATGSGETEAGSGEGDDDGGQSSLHRREELQFVSYRPRSQEEGAEPSTEDDGSTPDGTGDIVIPADNNELVDSTTKLHFAYPIDEDGVRAAIASVIDPTLESGDTDTAGETILGINPDMVTLAELASPSEDDKGSHWEMTIESTRRGDVEELISRLEVHFAEKPYFRSLADVGGQIAADAQVQAFAAILASLIGIVVYLWIRFQKVIFGFAAVVALVHDVLIVLGVISLSYWLSPVFGFLLVDNFKISLPVIAAFLTIIGYSLNDTIVVFDRIREVKGKNPKLTQEMLDTSISQTLSRTILTSLTTLIVVGILYFLGGEAIHAFAFSLVIGVLVGTYSSIFVASPTLYWLAKRADEA